MQVPYFVLQTQSSQNFLNFQLPILTANSKENFVKQGV